MSNQTVPGCKLTREDLPLIFATVACFISFIVYGLASAALGASIPELSRRFDRSESSFGAVFITRGIGYLCGTLGSAGILESKLLPFSKEFYTTISVCITGFATGLVTVAGDKHFSLVLFLFWLQGLGFGGLDTFANCVLPELWGNRVQPWMQALHSFFGIGAFIGPTLVGGLGAKNAHILISSLAMLPILGLAFQNSIIKISRHNLVATDIQSSNLRSTDDEFVQSENQKPDGDDNNNDYLDPSNNIDSSKTKPMPVPIKLLITLFFFFYVGCEIGFGGWISTYMTQADFKVTESDAAYMASIFWGALAIGRIIAIVTAMYVSTTNMLRIQLFLCIVACILVATLSSRSYIHACIGSGALGYALSSIYPLAMTLAGDYGIIQYAILHHTILLYYILLYIIYYIMMLYATTVIINYKMSAYIFIFLITNTNFLF